MNEKQTRISIGTDGKGEAENTVAQRAIAAIKKPCTSSEKTMARFWSKVDIRGPDDCWLWTTSTHRKGYGCFWDGNKRVRAHRFSFELHKSNIPIGKDCCHKCDNPSCVNPAHLFVGSRSDNMRDCARKGRFGNPRTKGEAHGCHKLVAAQVLEIRQIARTQSSQKVGAMFGVHPATIQRILNRQRWAHIPQPDKE